MILSKLPFQASSKQDRGVWELFYLERDSHEKGGDFARTDSETRLNLYRKGGCEAIPNGLERFFLSSGPGRGTHVNDGPYRDSVKAWRFSSW